MPSPSTARPGNTYKILLLAQVSTSNDLQTPHLFPAPEKEKPAKIEGGGGILKKSEVRDLLANLASLSDPKTKK